MGDRGDVLCVKYFDLRSDDIPLATGFNRWANHTREYKCRRHDRYLSCLRHSTILDERSTG
jgi:hypothetical protein